MIIKEIDENLVYVSCDDKSKINNLMNNYLVFIDSKTIIGEIISIKQNELIVNLIGEIINNNFIYGISAKPEINAKVSLVNPNYIPNIISFPNNYNSLYLGKSPIFNTNIYMNLNNFFNSHFTIMGGTGSGKSCALTRIIQNLFQNTEYIPYKSHFFIFDTYGEYQNAFSNLEKNNSYISYKCYTTNLKESGEILKIPPYLLGIDDLALLLNAETSSQLQVIRKALELVNLFKNNDSDLNKIKNNIIARAVLDILLSGRPAFQIRDQIISILSFYKTDELSLDTEIFQPGYTRALKHCLLIDADGKLREMNLLTDFFTKFLIDSNEEKLNLKVTRYTLQDIEDAIDFALISEGILKSEKIYDKNNILKVRIHNLVESEYSNYFDCDEFLTKEEYLNSLISKNNKTVQLTSFNINYVDDRFAKNIVKIISKMVFDMNKTLDARGSIPFHIILEEAHRYVLNDTDIDLLGYNIFDRIAKEGRKYGVILGLITQRPAELSETVLSQCNNFLVFKMTHPIDSDYVKKIIPYMTNEINQRLKILQPGNCYLFGSAFRLPLIVKFDLPNPTPNSNNVDIPNTWFIKKS
ncbi:MAG: DUF87 domain-containing protein [Bacilli bacterium]|nr:DUF87 domain-containing protein [Bacilli bacterium]